MLLITLICLTSAVVLAVPNLLPEDSWDFSDIFDADKNGFDGDSLLQDFDQLISDDHFNVNELQVNDADYLLSVFDQHPPKSELEYQTEELSASPEQFMPVVSTIVEGERSQPPNVVSTSGFSPAKQSPVSKTSKRKRKAETLDNNMPPETPISLSEQRQRQILMTFYLHRQH